MIEIDFPRICGSQRISKSFTSTKQTMFIMLHLDKPNPHNYITIKWHSEPGQIQFNSYSYVQFNDLARSKPGLVAVTKATTTTTTTMKTTTKWIPHNPVITRISDFDSAIIEQKCRQATNCNLADSMDDRFVTDKNSRNSILLGYVVLSLFFIFDYQNRDHLELTTEETFTTGLLR